jgi:hypothetical protein
MLGRNRRSPAPYRHASTSVQRRLALEQLEARTLPASIFIVPMTAPVDSTHVHRLAEAVAAAGPAGFVTIEPGTTPDTATVTVAQQGITIQGDPSASVSTLAGYNVKVAANGVTFAHMNLSSLIIGNGFNHTTITRNLIGTLQQVTAFTANGFDLITQNTITGSVTLTRNGDKSPANDDVSFNVFNGGRLSLQSSGGVTVRGNQFNSGGPTGAAITLVNAGIQTAPVTIANNFISFAGPSGIEIDGGQAGERFAISLLNNTITTMGSGTGIAFINPSTTVAFGIGTVLLQGNDFRGNSVGIAISIGNTPVGFMQIDLGGGALHSLGGNNFRGFTSSGTLTSAAITLSTSVPANVVSAHNNIFSAGIDPNTVIDDGSHGSHTGAGLIDVSAPLGTNAAFVQALYNDVLGRTGTLAEVNAWSGVVAAQGQAVVVNSIVHSFESLARVVQGLYVHLLQREPSSADTAAWAGFLGNGGTPEQMENAILTSPEYSFLNPQWVQSLYLNILGRAGSDAEVAAWNAAAPSIGLSAIASAFAASLEARMRAATTFFQIFLHRTPTALEALRLANLPGSVLDMEASLLSGAEYFSNG